MPTPGSPPTSTSDAGTSPPPSTRSSSGTPVEIRSDSSATTSTSRSGARAAPLLPPRGTGASATIVPNSPQPGQRPSQRPDAVPHSVQTCWIAAALAMGGPPYSRRPTAFVPISCLDDAQWLAAVARSSHGVARRRSNVSRARGEQLIGLVGPADPTEPLGVLEPDDRFLERDVDRSEAGGGGREQAIGLGRVAGEARTEPLRKRREIGRPQPDRSLFDDPEQPLGSVEVAEGERRFEPVAVPLLDVLRSEPERLPPFDRALRGRECLA